MNLSKQNFKKIMLVSVCIFVQLTAPSLFGAAAADTSAHMASQLSRSSPEECLAQKTNNGLIIILDSPIPNNIPVGALVLLRTLAEKTNSILVSASLIEFLYAKHEWMKLSEAKQYLDALRALPPDKRTEKDVPELECAAYLLYVAPFAHEWVIKKVNPSLCLLLHKSYLEKKKIPIDAVREYRTDGPLTTTEMQLGLKVNHMETATFADIKSPTTNQEFAPYFTEAMEKNSLFVTNAEYASSKFSSLRSAWSIFMIGHGLTDHCITGITLDAFKNFLSFLENKITTRLLYYVSCCGGGKNSSSIYHNPATGVDKTYNFAIINQSLPDSFVSIRIDVMNFAAFSHYATAPDCINYPILAVSIVPGSSAASTQNCIPQIKLPGVEWFSAIDESKVVSIGSLLAATRTKPLTIGTFFQKNGAPPHPLALLLYASNILCELKIDVSTPDGYAPAIVSMIPGDAFHTLRKISSLIHPIDRLEYSFIPSLEALTSKTFVIEEIEAPFSTNTHKELQASHKPDQGQNAIDSKKWIVMSKSKSGGNVPLSSFLYKGILYSIKLDHTHAPAVPLVPGTPEYNSYWLTIKAALQQQPRLPELAKELCAQPFLRQSSALLHQSPLRSARHTLTKIFELMADKANLHLPLLQFEKSNLELAWLLGYSGVIPLLTDLTLNLCQISDTNRGKSIHFDKLLIGGKERARNLVLRIAHDGLSAETVFEGKPRKYFKVMEKCSTSSPGGSQQNSTSLAQKKSSVPESTIEKRSTYEQATPERMKALGATLNSKENRESWLQKFSDTFTSDTLWVKEGGRWIKKIYKETKQYLAPYYEHEGEAFVPPSSSDSAVLKKLEEVEQ